MECNLLRFSNVAIVPCEVRLLCVLTPLEFSPWYLMVGWFHNICQKALEDQQSQTLFSLLALL